jgi:hypothetical protein
VPRALGELDKYDSADHELLWNQYLVHIDLYKLYFEALIKVNGIFFAVVAALIAFFATRQNPPSARVIPVLPCLWQFSWLSSHCMAPGC